MEIATKILSRNDTGETNSHQSGISIPKDVASKGIFPELSSEILNHRTEVTFFDEDNRMWKFQYIYYNDVFFGKPTNKAHNEYRLTCVKQYITINNIKSGDCIWFKIDDKGIRRIGFIKNSETPCPKVEKTERVTLVLKGGWKYIKTKN